MVGPRAHRDDASRPARERAGRYARQLAGYDAFLPAPLPPPGLSFDEDLVRLLSRADRALGTLAGTAQDLPNPDLFLLMYVRREAVLSSQIEGTEASLMDILEFEAERDRAERTAPIREVSNYVAALRYGLERLAELPLSLRLIREVHAQLMKGVRGGQPGKLPGEFRRRQNWIGGPSPATARFVPPPVPAMRGALADLERFLPATVLPTLIHIALVHAQFETIHPFLDGNGRVGRLLISIMLRDAGALEEPLLYLSTFFKEHRRDYYDRLQAVRDAGEWERWLAFFLEGVATVAAQATTTARRIARLRDATRRTIGTGLGRRSASGLRLLDHLFEQPVLTVKLVQDALDLSQPAAGALVRRMAELGVLEETTGRRRNRVFRFERYLELFEEREERA